MFMCVNICMRVPVPVCIHVHTYVQYVCVYSGILYVGMYITHTSMYMCVCTYVRTCVYALTVHMYVCLLCFVWFVLQPTRGH